MDAGFLDVLHDAADDDVFAVGERVHVHFGCVLEELVDQDRALGVGNRADLHRLRHVFFDGLQIVGDHHGASAENVARPDENRQADFGCGGDGFLGRERRAAARLRNIQFSEQRAEAAAIFREIDRFGIGADDLRAVALQLEREIQRSLPAELHDHALRIFALEHGEHVFESERLEVEAIGGVVIGRDRFRIAIHHDGLVAVFLEREGGVAAAIIEFDSLPDAAGAAAEDDDLGAVHRARIRLLPRTSNRDTA